MAYDEEKIENTIETITKDFRCGHSENMHHGLFVMCDSNKKDDIIKALNNVIDYVSVEVFTNGLSEFQTCAVVIVFSDVTEKGF